MHPDKFRRSLWAPRRIFINKTKPWQPLRTEAGGGHSGCEGGSVPVLPGQARVQRGCRQGHEKEPWLMSPSVGLCAPGRKIPVSVWRKDTAKLQNINFLNIKYYGWMPDHQDSKEEKDIDSTMLKPSWKQQRDFLWLLKQRSQNRKLHLFGWTLHGTLKKMDEFCFLICIK